MDKPHATPSEFAPCPCRSGKAFFRCHGLSSRPLEPAVPAPELAAPLVTRKLDLACGQDCREGFEGVDRAQLPGVKHVWDLMRYPWPFEDNSVAEIFCSHYIEHIPMVDIDGQDALLRFFDECYRILIPGGWMQVVTPNARCDRAFQDPTHRRFIVQQTFAYLDANWRAAAKIDHYNVKCNFGVACDPIIFTELMVRHPLAQERMFRESWNTILDWTAKLQSRKAA